MTYAAPVGVPAGSAEPTVWPRLPSRIGTLCLLELRKIRHDPFELLTRTIQPALWLIIFGATFSRISAIPTGGIAYLDFLAPGILAQSALFVAIFFGIQAIGERDAGVLAKLMVTPTHRVALVAGKAFAAGVRATAQGVVVIMLAVLLRVTLTGNPLRILAAFGVLVLGTAFFACLSLVLAGLVLRQDRLMGIGQAIIMPLFFGSNALYPIDLMPVWLRWLGHVNPLSYQVDALRGLLIGTPANLAVDLAVLVAMAALGITAASLLLNRLTR